MEIKLEINKYTISKELWDCYIKKLTHYYGPLLELTFPEIGKIVFEKNESIENLNEIENGIRNEFNITFEYLYSQYNQNTRDIPPQYELGIKLQEDISVYLNRSIPLCIILNDEKNYPWFYENFLQITSQLGAYGVKRLRLDFCPIPFEDLLHTSEYTFDDIRKWGNIHKFIIEKINKGIYLFINLDEFYLPEKNNFMNRHFVHPSLIFGYDNDAKKYLAIGFSKGVFKKISFDYDTFSDAFENTDLDAMLSVSGCNKHVAIWAYKLESIDGIFRLRDYDDNYHFDTNKFLNGLKEFIFSIQGNYKNYAITSTEKEVTRFGYEVYDIVIHSLLGHYKDVPPVNYIAMHLIWEHSKGIFIRLKYVASRYHLSIELTELINNYINIVNKFNRIRLAYNKQVLIETSFRTLYLPIKSEVVINKIVQLLMSAKTEGYELLNKIYEKLILEL